MSDRRRGKLANPTAERTSDQSTQSASGLSGGKRGRPLADAHHVHAEYPEDTVARDHRGVQPTPRRYDEGQA